MEPSKPCGLGSSRYEGKLAEAACARRQQVSDQFRPRAQEERLCVVSIKLSGQEDSVICACPETFPKEAAWGRKLLAGACALRRQVITDKRARWIGSSLQNEHPGPADLVAMLNTGCNVTCRGELCLLRSFGTLPPSTEA